MLFLFCCASADMLNMLPTINWQDQIPHLSLVTDLSSSQLGWIVGRTIQQDEVSKFNRAFSSQLPLGEIQKFQRIMHRLLTDIVQGVSVTTEALEENKHSLHPIYQRVLAYRDADNYSLSRH